MVSRRDHFKSLLKEIPQLSVVNCQFFTIPSLKIGCYNKRKTSGGTLMNDPRKHPLAGLLKMMSSPDFDLDDYLLSESFAGIVENQAVMAFARDEAGEEAIAYWKERGLQKQLHGGPEQHTKWASYLPLDHGTGKKYPLLFVMHGAGNPIILAESYGFTKIAAREQMIVIIPEDETAENMDKLFAYAREHYDVDWSRVYMVGYSLGGFMTSRHAMRWPERFAAVGTGGMLFANGHAIDHPQGGIVWPGETITPEMVARAAQFGIPACLCMGEQEVLGLLPVTQDEPANPWAQHVAEQKEEDPEKNKRIDLTGKNKIASLNNWRIANGCDPFCEESVRSHTPADIVEKTIAFPFERTSVDTRENRNHYIGDAVTSQGENNLRVIALAKSAHWPSQALCELIWEFISQFAVDPETGRSYRISK